MSSEHNVACVAALRKELYSARLVWTSARPPEGSKKESKESTKNSAQISQAQAAVPFPLLLPTQITAHPQRTSSQRGPPGTQLDHEPATNQPSHVWNAAILTGKYQGFFGQNREPAKARVVCSHPKPGILVTQTLYFCFSPVFSLRGFFVWKIPRILWPKPRTSQATCGVQPS